MGNVNPAHFRGVRRLAVFETTEPLGDSQLAVMAVTESVCNALQNYAGAIMPILFMALLALLVFIVIGAICFAAVVAESRQAERAARQQPSVTTREVLGKTEEVQLSQR